MVLRSPTWLLSYAAWAVWLCGHPLAAQEGQARFRRLSIEQGLSQSSVFCVLQDADGFLWVGTKEGLNRYDGYTFQTYRHHPEQPGSLSGNYVLELTEDRSGTMWVGTYGGGLNRYDKKTGAFTAYKHDVARAYSLVHNHVRALCEDRRGFLWVGTQNGLDRLDPTTGVFHHFPHGDDATAGPGGDFILDLFEDRAGNLWVGTFGGGLSRFDPETQTFTTFRHRPGDPNSLSHDTVYSILEDREGVLWVGTFGGGLCRFDPATGRFQTFRHIEGDPDSLSHDHVYDLWEDRDGVLWIGANGGGLNRFDRATGRFTSFRQEAGDPFSLSNDNVLCVYEDRAGILWVGTFGGGLNRYDKASASFVSYRPGRNDATRLNHPNVWSLEEGADGRLWVGTNGGGLSAYDRASRTFQVYRADPTDPGALSDDRVLVVHEDRFARLWVGTFGGGLNRFDEDTGRFETFRRDEQRPDSLPVDIVFSLAEASDGTLWVGTEGGGVCRLNADGGFTCFSHREADADSLAHNSIFSLFVDSRDVLWVGTFGGGLDRMTEDGRFRHFQHDPDDPHSLSNNRVYALTEDRAGDLWVGTAEGLNHLPRGADAFTVRRAQPGFPNDVVYAVTEDREGMLWLSTNRGLARFSPQTDSFRHFDAGDGLLSDELNHNAALLSRDGHIFVGGVNGFNSFLPGDVAPSSFIPPVRITGLRIAGEPVFQQWLQPSSPLAQSVEHTGTLVLDHTQRMFSLEFAALDFSFPSRNRYAYRLEGFNDDWIETDAANRRAGYTNLAAGTYRFHVKGSNHDGVWNEDGAVMTLVLRPPPWWSPAAKFFYLAVLLGLVLFCLRLFRLKLEREKQDARRQKELAARSEEVAARLREVDKLKDEFLANTSHELRTPLHGIIGLAESLRDGEAGSLGEDARGTLAMIVAGGKRLTALVNDILDFSKMRNMELVLQHGPVDMPALTDMVCRLIQPLLRGKDLRLVNRVAPGLPRVFGDESRIQQVMYNLLGNAVKFTDHGQITLEAEVREGRLFVAVGDTGIGIPLDKQEQIFETFAQVESGTARRFGGTGLGLAVTRKLVELHGGSLTVSSRPGEGSVFTFSLEVYDDSRFQESVLPIADLPAGEVPEDAEAAVAPVETQGTGPVILIVDDEPVNRRVLRNHLSGRNYRLLEADGGRAALEIAARTHVDLVLLDVMMPEVSGYDVCRVLRRDHGMGSLPVIFLSARARAVDAVEGLKLGGNDYLVKPIDKNELLSRLDTHLQLQELRRDLEEKVRLRTLELLDKNAELDARYRELETLDRMVDTMNREMAFSAVVSVVLEGVMTLFPGTARAFCMLADADRRRFRVRAAVGYDGEVLDAVALTPEDAAACFHVGDTEVEAVWHARVPDAVPPSFAGLPHPAARLCVGLTLKGGLAGYLVCEHGSGADAFAAEDPRAVARYRAHVVSALAKAEALEEILAAQERLQDASRRAGMADIAISVQHNIGNTLSSALTSLHTLDSALAREEHPLTLLERTAGLLPRTAAGLAKFFKTDPRAGDVPKVFVKTLEALRTYRGKLLGECRNLEGHLQRIRDDLHAQRETAGLLAVREKADLNTLLGQILEAHAFQHRRLNIDIETDFQPLPPVDIDICKVKRCLTYLLENAWEAIAENDVRGRIRLTSAADDGGVWIRLSDNGIGFPEQQGEQLFRHGYSSKAGRKGFGLHYCANALSEMCASIKLEPAPGGGTTAALFFPLR